VSAEVKQTGDCTLRAFELERDFTQIGKLSDADGCRLAEVTQAELSDLIIVTSGDLSILVIQVSQPDSEDGQEGEDSHEIAQDS
jgi:hypothetical protein